MIVEGIVREYIEAHGGRIEVTSSAQHGTHFVATLPRQRARRLTWLYNGTTEEEETRLGEMTGEAAYRTKAIALIEADPKTDPDATRYDHITHQEALERNLKVMDATALALCRDQKLPINVFSIFKDGALRRVVMGEDEGTLVHN